MIELQQFFHVHVNVVATPENLPVIATIGDLMNRHRITLHVDPYVDHHYRYSPEELVLLTRYTKEDRKSLVRFDDFNRKQCSAGRNYINLLPDGSVFTCAAGFSYTFSPPLSEIVDGRDVSRYRMGNLFDGDFVLNTRDMICELPCKDACDRDAVTVWVAKA